MKFCKYCGKEIEDDAIICSDCNGKASKLKQSSPAAASGFSANRVAALFREKKKHLLIAAAAIAFIVVALVVVNIGKCHVSGCKNRVVAGSDYCYTHKCSVSDCPNRKSISSNYCYTHSKVYDDDSPSESANVYSWELSISDKVLTSNSSYTIAEGKITNKSSYTVYFVKIKGTFKDSSGNVVDTDWTYAVGSEGLAPGESKKWRMSVSKDYSVKRCDVSVIDFDT